MRGMAAPARHPRQSRRASRSSRAAPQGGRLPRLRWDTCGHREVGLGSRLRRWWGGTEQAREKNKGDGVMAGFCGRNPHRVPGTVPTRSLLFQWQQKRLSST